MIEERNYICVKDIFKFLLNKEYTFIINDKEDYFKFSVKNDYGINYGDFSEDYIDKYFILSKIYYRELNLKALFDE